MSNEYYIGLMSGTSLDGIDAGLYRFTDNKIELIHFYYRAYPANIKQKILKLCDINQPISLLEYGKLDTQLGAFYADACLTLLTQAKVDAHKVKAIGSHGQTILHAPNSTQPFTLQIGNPNIISQITGITTIADFRRRDIAAGGQGAPLVPAFHHAMFHSCKNNRVIINIGGIANITTLPKDSHHKMQGFDTGPGNTLMDYWILTHKNKTYDNHGAWAASGEIKMELLNAFKNDPYFSLPPPKSTGTEYFSSSWLSAKLRHLPHYAPEDVQRTLCQLTATTIAEAIHHAAPKTEQALLCGGGTHNSTLLKALQQLLNNISIHSTDTLGAPPDQVEAMAFAWLAKQTLTGITGNAPEATGAKEAVILGGIYQA